MKRSKIILFLTLFILACNDNSRTQKNFTPISEEIFNQIVNDSSQTTIKILDRLLPSINHFSKIDTSEIFYGTNYIEEDTIFRHLLIGKTIDNNKILATEVNLKDTLVGFYYLTKEKWKLVGRSKPQIDIYSIRFEDLDGDNKKEIVTSTSPNMNGNTWNEIYYSSKTTDTVKYAGSFSSTIGGDNVNINLKNKTLEETYEGSWYMNPSQTLYKWKGEMLVPIKMVVRVHKEPVSYESGSTFEYYENPTEEFNGLKLKLREPFTDSKKQNQIWDNFFKNKNPNL